MPDMTPRLSSVYLRIMRVLKHFLIKQNKKKPSSITALQSLVSIAIETNAERESET